MRTTREEHAALLRNVERTKPVIASKPAISTKEWADDPGLNIVVYAYTPNMPMNAHKSAQEGAK